MEGKIKYVLLFPEEYTHLNKSYQQLQQQLTALDYELDNAPKDKGHTFDFTPPGMKASSDADMRGKRAEYLGTQRTAIIDEYKLMFSQEIVGLDTKTQKTVLDRYDFETSENEFKEYSKDELTEVTDVNKQDETSFDFMAASHFNKYQQPEKFFTGEKENIDVWSENYTKILDDYRGKHDSEIEKDTDEPSLNLE